MQGLTRLAATFVAFSTFPVAGQQALQTMLRLHPGNSHYLEYRGKPTVLITSGEHYGALLNLDFDHKASLDELRNTGLNLTRTFSGTYLEVAESFGITDNTLAPRRYLGPWARSLIPGTADGGNKFDIQKFELAYFDRLRDFVLQASRRGIVVEFVLFCPFYNEKLWSANPMNAANNVNGIGSCGREEVYTLRGMDRHEDGEGYGWGTVQACGGHEETLRSNLQRGHRSPDRCALNVGIRICHTVQAYSGAFGTTIHIKM